jgi:hypothetical protein
MRIKKLLLLLALIGITSSCFAQINWEVRAGMNYSNVTAKDRDGNKANTSSVPGIYLGLGAGIPLSDQFSVQPSIVYSKRGFKQPGASFVGWGKDFEAKVSYFELPVDFLYSPKIGPGNLLLAAGPYVGYGTGGSWKTSGPVTVGDIMFEGKGDISFQNDNSTSGKGTNSYTYAKPWDYGVHLRLGYALFGQYSLSFELQYGVADLAPRWADYKPENSLRNKSFGVVLGYRFK